MIFRIFILLTSSVVLLLSCNIYEELPTEYDYSYRAKFRSYTSFDFFKDSSIKGDTSLLFSNEVIEKVIAGRMSSQGYRLKTRNPNLLVLYKLYFDSLNFKGYRQPELEEWLKEEKEDERYIEEKYDLRTGTLLIVFFDRKQKNTIWQGYATRLYGNSLINNEQQLKNAVRSILDRYKVVTRELIEEEYY